MPDKNYQQTLDNATFLRIRKWYLLAFAAIAVTIIVAQILIQSHLNSQLSDSRIINVAGRQRAYSQKLTKEILLIKNQYSNQNIGSMVSELEHTLRIWSVSHEALQKGNDSLGIPKENNSEILALFAELQPHHNKMLSSAKKLLTIINRGGN